MPAREFKKELEELRAKMAEHQQQLQKLHTRIEDLEAASDAAVRTVEDLKKDRSQRQIRKS